MKCLVTGAAGFIGSHLCERLIADGHTVIGIDDLSAGRTANLDSIKTNPLFHFVLASINDDVSKCFDGVDWVFHLAGKADIVPSIENPTLYHDTNVTGTVRTLENARIAKVKRFIYAASSSCYGIPNTYPTSETAPASPMYPYALTKYLGEQYVMHWSKVYGVPAVSLRLFNVYGPRSRTSGAYGAVFGVFLSQLAHGMPLTVVGDGEQTRDFTFVSDVVEAFVRAAESGLTGWYMNVGSGGHYSVNHLVGLLRSGPGPTCPVVPIPERPGEPKTTFADISRIKFLLDWRAMVSFETGVEIMKRYIGDYINAPCWTPESIAGATKSWFECLGEK